MDAEKKSDADHPSSAAKVGFRFSAAISLFGTKREAANKLGVSTDQLARYAKGSTSPPLSVLARLSAEKGVSLDWLATGHGSMRPALDAAPPSPDDARSTGDFDEELHAHLVDGIIAVYREENVGLPPRDLGRLAARIHADLVAAYDDPDDRKVALKLALQHLRRDLRAAPTDGQSKRRA